MPKRIFLSYKFVVFVLLAFFFLKGLDLAVNIDQKIFPDEDYHMNLIQIYKNDDDGLIVENFPSTYYLGNITHVPYFYHMLFSKFLYLNIFGIEDLIFLRIIGLMFSTATCFIIFKTAQKLTDRKLVWILSLVIATNIPIFTFIAGSVNYDVLVNFFAAGSIYLLISYLDQKKIIQLILLAAALSLGCLTKVSFIPLALIIFIILIFGLRKKILRKSFYLDNFKQFKKNKFVALLGLITIVLVIGTMQFFLQNLRNYHAITPACDQVLTKENCMQDDLYRRDLALKEADHGELMRPFEYSVRWSYLMLQRTVSEIGHLSLIRSKFVILSYAAVLFLAYSGFIKRYSIKETKWNYLLIISIFYALVLLFYQNYPAYRQNGDESLGLQGRYILPVLGPLAILIARGLLFSKNKWVNIIIFLLISIFFIGGDYVYFKIKAAPEFYGKQTAEVLVERDQVKGVVGN